MVAVRPSVVAFNRDFVSGTPNLRRLHHGLVDKAFVDSGTYEIEVAGEKVAASAQLQPFYDPKSERVKA